MKSAFVMLLEEAQAVLHQAARGPVPVHFTWDGTSGPESWSCWPEARLILMRQVYKGSTGEGALRGLTEALRGGWPLDA